MGRVALEGVGDEPFVPLASPFPGPGRAGRAPPPGSEIHPRGRGKSKDWAWGVRKRRGVAYLGGRHGDGRGSG